jgi:hypothetical protein
MSWLKDNLIALLVAALIASLVFGGWNYWRKNVYYTALHDTAAKRTADARNITSDLQAKADNDQTQLEARHREREKFLVDQLAYLSEHPVVRTEYVVQERWRSRACAAGTDGKDGDVPGAGGGFPVELEQYALRAFVAADGVVDERNTCVAMYNRARDAAIEWNKKYGR